MRSLKIFSIIVALAAFGSCKKFSDFQTNPNNPTQTDPALLLTAIEEDAFSTIDVEANLASRQLVYQQSVDNNQYYNWQRSSFNYSWISQTIQMEKEAARVGKTNFRYIAKFLRATYIIDMTQRFGDIPYSQMMQSLTKGDVTDSAATRPVYDGQESIYAAVLDDLKIASDSLSTSATAINGDIIYDGDITSWKKLINAYTLRVLMSLSKKESDATLNIKQRFSDIVSNPTAYPLMASNSDNGQLTYYDITGNQYIYYNSNSMKTNYYLDSSFVVILKNLNDPRLFVFGEPTTASGLSAGDFNGYDGLPGSASLAYNINKSGDGKASQIHTRYAYDATNEPSVLMGYAEQEFLLAEAVYRGWISGDANTYYKAGIEAAMEFSDYKSTYSASDITTYLGQSAVALQSGTELSQIITQKYISQFMNCGWQIFYEQRRTGYPTFDVSGAGILNGGKIPTRWMYPSDEYVTNATNVQDAVNSQYGGTDDINGVMWLIK